MCRIIIFDIFRFYKCSTKTKVQKNEWEKQNRFFANKIMPIKNHDRTNYTELVNGQWPMAMHHAYAQYALPLCH